MPVRVLIADDHAVVRKGLVQILEEDPDVRVLAEAADGPGALDIARRHEADVFVLDLNMPGQGGLDVLHALRAEFPNLGILILTVHAEEQYGPRMLRAGAAGFLEKNAAPERLLEAVRRIAGGRRFITPDLAEALLDDSETSGPPHRQLSDRELQVLVALAEGSTVSDIAERLSLSVKTISTYRSRVLKKLRVDSNAELARYALEYGLIA